MSTEKYTTRPILYLKASKLETELTDCKPNMGYKGRVHWVLDHGRIIIEQRRVKTAKLLKEGTTGGPIHAYFRDRLNWGMICLTKHFIFYPNYRTFKSFMHIYLSPLF